MLLFVHYPQSLSIIFSKLDDSESSIVYKVSSSIQDTWPYSSISSFKRHNMNKGGMLVTAEKIAISDGLMDG